MAENRNNIALYGLEAWRSDKKAVFANNQHFSNVGGFCPYNLDGSFHLRYNLWQIDTSAVKVDWHLDPFLPGEENFICTFSNIPAKALTLFDVLPTKLKSANSLGDINGMLIEEVRIVENKSIRRLIDRNHFH